MFGGICNTTPSDLINLLCKDIPRLVLVVSDQRDKIQDPIMRAIADEMTVESQSSVTQRNWKLSSTIIQLMAQGILFDNKGHYGRMRKEGPPEHLARLREICGKLHNLATTTSSATVSDVSRAYNPRPPNPNAYSNGENFKVNKGITLTWDECKKRSGVLPHVFYLMQHVNTNLQVSEPSQLMNYCDLTDDSRPTKSYFDEGRHKGRPFIVIGGCWENVFAFQGDRLVWKGDVVKSVVPRNADSSVTM